MPRQTLPRVTSGNVASVPHFPTSARKRRTIDRARRGAADGLDLAAQSVVAHPPGQPPSPAVKRCQTGCKFTAGEPYAIAPAHP